MSSLGNTGIINWVWEFPYDLSWLNAELITQYNKRTEPTEDLSLYQPHGERYDGDGMWIDDFRDKKGNEDPDDEEVMKMVASKHLPEWALVWAGTDEEEPTIDSIYHTEDISKTYIPAFDWWICNDFEYTQAVIDKVKELNPKVWAKWRTAAY